MKFWFKYKVLLNVLISFHFSLINEVLTDIFIGLLKEENIFSKEELKDFLIIRDLYTNILSYKYIF